MEPATHPTLTYYLVHWIVAALMIAVANFLLWPLLIFLTLPLNILTLGLFTFVVNGIVLKIASLFVPGFHVEGFLAAVFGSLFLAIIGALLHFVFV